MATIRLLIDEDVRPLLAETLRQRGFDAKHVDELTRSGLSDPEQLAFAVKQRRAILTHNIRRRSGAIPRIAAGTMRCLSRKSDTDIRNQVVWLQDFK